MKIHLLEEVIRKFLCFIDPLCFYIIFSSVFRTLGLRHIIIVDGELRVVGIITRADMNEHHLAHYWQEQREKMQHELNIDTLPPAIVYETKTIRDRSGSILSNFTAESLEEPEDPEIAAKEGLLSDSPKISIRKKISS